MNTNGGVIRQTPITREELAQIWSSAGALADVRDMDDCGCSPIAVSTGVSGIRELARLRSYSPLRTSCSVMWR
jgi:hypothetical protein